MQQDGFILYFHMVDDGYHSRRQYHHEEIFEEPSQPIHPIPQTKHPHVFLQILDI